MENEPLGSVWAPFLMLAIPYLIPTIIALLREHHSKLAIIAVNVLLGWTGLGWIWAFIWSLTGAHKTPK